MYLSSGISTPLAKKSWKLESPVKLWTTSPSWPPAMSVCIFWTCSEPGDWTSSTLALFSCSHLGRYCAQRSSSEPRRTCRRSGVGAAPPAAGLAAAGAVVAAAPAAGEAAPAAGAVVAAAAGLVAAAAVDAPPAAGALVAAGAAPPELAGAVVGAAAWPQAASKGPAPSSAPNRSNERRPYRLCRLITALLSSPSGSRIRLTPLGNASY